MRCPTRRSRFASSASSCFSPGRQGDPHDEASTRFPQRSHRNSLRLPPAEGAPDAGVMDLVASIRVLFDRKFLPLESQLQLFQYVIEEHVQRKLRVRPPAAHAQVRQDKFPEPLEVQFRRNALPALTFRHLRPREKETVGLLRRRDPNGTIPRSCGRIRPFWKPATSRMIARNKQACHTGTAPESSDSGPPTAEMALGGLP